MRPEAPGHNRARCSRVLWCSPRPGCPARRRAALRGRSQAVARLGGIR